MERETRAKGDAQAEKERRLAEALRANLKRRKAQSRERKGAGAESSKNEGES